MIFGLPELSIREVLQHDLRLIGTKDGYGYKGYVSLLYSHSPVTLSRTMGLPKAGG